MTTPSNLLDINSPTANMYGCQPCPKCKSQYRIPYRRGVRGHRSGPTTESVVIVCEGDLGGGACNFEEEAMMIGDDGYPTAALWGSSG
jgi:hypothetical protein